MTPDAELSIPGGAVIIGANVIAEEGAEPVRPAGELCIDVVPLGNEKFIGVVIGPIPKCAIGAKPSPLACGAVDGTGAVAAIAPLLPLP